MSKTFLLSRNHWPTEQMSFESFQHNRKRELGQGCSSNNSKHLSFHSESGIAVPELHRVMSSANISILIPEEVTFSIPAKYIEESVRLRAELCGYALAELECIRKVLLSFTFMNLLCRKSEVEDNVFLLILKKWRSFKISL
ncbi:hypothetical protein TNCV_4629141 [Trichonephila clavipes]|nr:hypothetical protein TNCV_4629141 [Trichonephila clavipes]